MLSKGMFENGEPVIKGCMYDMNNSQNNNDMLHQGISMVRYRTVNFTVQLQITATLMLKSHHYKNISRKAFHCNYDQHEMQNHKI
jgi:hypothetical protein